MRKKTIKILYWVFTILLAGFMLFSGFSELMHTSSADKVISDLGYPLYVNSILGVAKILGALAVLQARFRILKEWAYAGFAIDLVGAAASLAFVQGAVVVLNVIPFFVVLFASYILWKNVDKMQIV